MTFFLSKRVRLDGMVLTVNTDVMDTVETALCVKSVAFAGVYDLKGFFVVSFKVHTENGLHGLNQMIAWLSSL